MKTKIRILHIDDNIHDRQLVKDVLLKETDEFEVLEAESREKFEQIISENNFDLVLSDFNILGFDGLQVLQVVKEKKPEIPVIIVTGTGSEEIAVQAMKSGADDYVIKSVKHIQNLIPTIRKVIENNKIHLEHKKTLKDLCESEERFRLLFNNSMDAVLLTVPDGTVLRANSAACNIFGRSEEELKRLGRDCAIDATDPRLKMALEERLHTGKFTGELTGLRGDGTPFPMEVSSSIYEDSEGNTCSSMIIRDITSRKETELLLKQKTQKIETQNEKLQLLNEQLLKTNEELNMAKEKAEESDRLKTAFLHNISHEIRTPMNAIIGFSGLLNTADLSDEKIKFYTDIIVQSSENLLSIITDIINIATIEAGQDILQENTINLNKALDLIYEKFKLKAQNKNISFTYTKSLKDENAIIRTDDTKVIEILSILIGNALKFTSSGHIKYGYVIKSEHIEFFIEDTGIGIPKDLHEEIFKRFNQADNSSERHYGGSGIGLSISKAYVEKLRGKIWLESLPGKGSVFYFTLPFVKADFTEKEKPNPKDNSLAKSVKTRTILVVEDEDLNLILVDEILSEQGFTILKAKNGLESVEICKQNKNIDLVLMDIKMPIMDGYSATRKIKELQPELPIIAQTAYTDHFDQLKAITSGCVDFISKPFTEEQLLSKIKAYIVK